MRFLLSGLILLASGAAATPPIMPGPPPQPPVTAEALEMGQRMAASGDFHAIIGAMSQAQLEEIVRETPDLSEAERARLGEIGRRHVSEIRSRLTRDVGAIYARRFSVEEMRSIVAFFESPAGRAYRNALPRMLPEIGAAMEGIDLKRDMLADFCRETGKGCANR